MTQEEICASKNIYFELEGAEHATKFQPDKSAYKCSICNHYHLTTANKELSREELLRSVGSLSIAKVTNKDNTTHRVIKSHGRLFYVIKHNSGKKHLEEITSENGLPKKLVVKLRKHKAYTDIQETWNL